jgi:hypothetical protein
MDFLVFTHPVENIEKQPFIYLPFVLGNEQHCKVFNEWFGALIDPHEQRCY